MPSKRSPLCPSNTTTLPIHRYGCIVHRREWNARAAVFRFRGDGAAVLGWTPEPRASLVAEAPRAACGLLLNLRMMMLHEGIGR